MFYGGNVVVICILINNLGCVNLFCMYVCVGLLFGLIYALYTALNSGAFLMFRS